MTPYDVGTIADAIQRYLELHPDAADSVEGIQRWWLVAPVHEKPLEVVQAALDDLEARKIVAKAVIEGGRVIYLSARSRPRSGRG